MTEFNRRRFLQIAGAAGLAPVMPALPARAAVAAPAGSGAAQMLWASLYANAGATPNVTGLARAMGITPHAAQGVYGKLIQNHALTTQAAARLAKTTQSRAIKVDLKKLLADDEVTDEDTLDTTEIDREIEPSEI